MANDQVLENFDPRKVKGISQLPEAQYNVDSKSSFRDISAANPGWLVMSYGMRDTGPDGGQIVKYHTMKVNLSAATSHFRDGVLSSLKEFGFPWDDYVAYRNRDSQDETRTSDIIDFGQMRDICWLFFKGQNHKYDLSCNNVPTFRAGAYIDGDIYVGSDGSDLTLEQIMGTAAMNLSATAMLLQNRSPMFIDKDSLFQTKYFNVENNLTEEDSEAPTTESEKHNRYVFRLVNYRSNEWTTPIAGVFSCWGWVDMYTDAHPGANPEAWIALEGFIGGKWRILQVQPFDKHNGQAISYVGFTFPVGAGLDLRLTSGFRVGTNSNKYQSTNGSLANHIANCFVGGVYAASVMPTGN